MVDHASERRLPRTGTALALTGVLLLAGCGEGTETPFNFLKPKPGAEEAGTQTQDKTTTKLVERDVEAPEVFQVTEKGLWDGRPSLGGVWVAHPEVDEPERVIIRNTGNSKFVIGALFRRERNNPGPSIQVSSDAADALGMLAGAPAELNVTALRRETEPAEEDVATATEGELTAPEEVEETALDPVAGASAAIDAAEAETDANSDGNAVARPKSKPQTPARASSLEKPYIQIGIFSVEQNAKNTATAMRQNGMVPTVKKQSSQGKTFWRVIVGPAASVSERGTLLRKIKGVGFADAYPVTN